MFLSRVFGRKRLKLPKIVVILGPTAAGKTAWGIRVAQMLSGEVVSADSRQVYRGMDVGTAKPDGKWTQTVILSDSEGSLKLRKRRDSSAAPQNDSRDDNGVFIVEGEAHHLMDIVEPDENFSLADFKARALAAIDDILRRGKLPIIVGGTGLYIQAIVDNLEIPAVKPDEKLRAELEKKTLEEQIKMLQEIDPESARVIDTKNPRRVLRALEVAITSGESFTAQQKKGAPVYDALQIGVDVPREVLYERINKRVDEQIEQGLVEETRGLLRRYAPRNDTQMPSMSGIGYKQMGYYLRGEMTLPQAIEILKRDTRNYAKRQMTWFKRDKRIKWVSDWEEARKMIERFLKK